MDLGIWKTHDDIINVSVVEESVKKFSISIENSMELRFSIFCIIRSAKTGDEEETLKFQIFVYKIGHQK